MRALAVAAAMAIAPLRAGAEEPAALHFQATVATQAHPSFTAAYSGNQSDYKVTYVPFTDAHGEVARSRGRHAEAERAADHRQRRGRHGEAEDPLHQQWRDDETAHVPEVRRELGDERRGEVPLGEEAQRQERMLGPSLDDDEQGEGDRRSREQPQHQRLGPPNLAPDAEPEQRADRGGGELRLEGLDFGAQHEPAPRDDAIDGLAHLARRLIAGGCGREREERDSRPRHCVSRNGEPSTYCEKCWR